MTNRASSRRLFVVQGAQGFQGAIGVGQQGPQGVVGAVSVVPGPQGNQGSVGVGQQGPQGVVGAVSTVPGPQGNQGAIGVGQQGPQGEVGANSTVPGPQGVQGVDGNSIGHDHDTAYLKLSGSDLTGTMGLNAKELRIRGKSDGNHTLVYDAGNDGPHLKGYGGVSLSSVGNGYQHTLALYQNNFRYDGHAVLHEGNFDPSTKLSDAPSDGKQYARLDAEWAEVASGGASVAIDDTTPTGDDLFWFQPTSGKFFITVDAQWVKIN